MQNLKYLFILFVLALSACSGAKGLRVVSQTQPNPLQGSRDFALLAFTDNNLLISGNPEAQFLAGKGTDEESVAFQAAQRQMEAAFARGLQTEMTRLGMDRLQPASTAQSLYFIQVNVDDIEPGFNYYIRSKRASVRFTVRIVDAQQYLIDEISIHVVTGSSYLHHVSERLERIGENSGVRLGRYLAQRTGHSSS
jgi:hypothetical protein